jgi:hypothetical protein
MRRKVRIVTARGRRRASDGESAWAISSQCIPALAVARHPGGRPAAHHSFTQI